MKIPCVISDEYVEELFLIPSIPHTSTSLKDVTFDKGQNLDLVILYHVRRKINW